MTKADDDQVWKDILDDDEHVVWQGRPDAAFVLTPAMIGTAIFAIFFAGFALFWMIGASFAGGIFWTFGLLHFGAGIALLVGTLAGPSFIRKRTFYSLTNKRAFVAKDLPMKGRTLKSYPITQDTQLEYRENDKSSVYFSTETHKTDDATITKNIGFERINDAREVLRLMRNIQKGQA
ncbi:MAG: aspartate carbamoyltransferase catalytic subunit [Pseudomonadota bacterium]